MVATVYVVGGRSVTSSLHTSTGTGATQWFIGWGTGGSSTGATATSGNTGLAVAASEARVAASLTTTATETTRYTATITAGTAKTIEEMGVFYATVSGTATAGGVLFIRASHGGVTLATGDSIAYTADISWS